MRAGLLVLPWTDAPGFKPRTELSEAFPQLGSAQAPSTPKEPVATRREEEERNYYLDHSVDTLNKQSVSPLPIWKPGQNFQLVPEITFHWLWRELPKRGHLAAPCVPIIPTRTTMATYCQSTHRVFRCRISLMSHASTRPGTI